MATYTPSVENQSALQLIQQAYPLLLPSGTVLKAEQWEVLEATQRGTDVFCCLPTAYGKSVTYILQPLLQDITFPSRRHAALVVSPLLSIITEQVKRLQDAGVQAVHLTCNYNAKPEDQIWYATPEYVATKAFRLFLKGSQERVVVLVVDECHCVSTWGLQFRKSYRRVCELVSCLEAPLLLLTGTATAAVKNDIFEQFGLESALTVARTPDRPNIKIMVHNVPHSPKCLQWLVDKLLIQGQAFSKTVVFCISSEDASKLYMWALDQLEHAGKAYTSGDAIVEDRVLDMYHSSVAEDALSRVEKDFPKANSVIRLLFSTIKLGMGVDILGLDNVVLYGVPSSMMDLWQMVGRCAHGHSAKGTATIYVTKRSLRLSSDPAVCDLQRADKCFRATILEAFCTTSTSPEYQSARCQGQCDECDCGLCRCCNFCQGQCACS